MTGSAEEDGATTEADGVSPEPQHERHPDLRYRPRRAGASGERLYIVTYDVADPKRGRRVFRLMRGHGRWLQLSVFQCRLTGRRRAELGAALDALINHSEDHVILLDLGPAESVDPRVESLGKTFETIERRAVVI